MSAEMRSRIAAAMGCALADDDLVEAVRLLVAERAQLRAYLRDATDDAAGLVERVHRAVETYQGVVRERDAARARCAAVCREVACFYDSGDVGSVVALACADAIERESLDIQTIAK